MLVYGGVISILPGDYGGLPYHRYAYQFVYGAIPMLESELL